MNKSKLIRTSKEKDQEPSSSPTETQQTDLNRWQEIAMRIQARKQWSQHAQLLKYSKSGCPKKFVPAKGVGSHLGRWSWGEIAYEW